MNITSTEGIKNKEIINVSNGRSLGFVSDLEIDVQKGIIEGIVVPVEKGFFSMLGKYEDETIIKWESIRRIGEDVILVEIDW